MSTTLSPDCINLVMKYLTPLPKFAFEKELIEKTWRLKIGVDEWKNITAIEWSEYYNDWYVW